MAIGWAAYKAARWTATVDADASAAYAVMFGRAGVPDPTTRVSAPVLAIAGEQDGPTMRRDGVIEAWSPLCENLRVTSLADVGHYPMQEMPPLTVSLVERFVAGDP
jgi:pimeloyl-ACP methyl ester carboxylesterase